MKILVLGGTQFFGKRLVNNLIKSENEVFVLSRGNRPLEFVGNYHHLKGDRDNKEEFKSLLGEQSFDIVFDQICFDYETAKTACELFKDRVKHYIFTSSQSVYDAGKCLPESAFNPETHTFENEVKMNENYAEAKRQAEVGFVRHADFKTTFVRFPIVIGEEDPTQRFHFHVKRIQEGKEIYFPNLDAHMSFIYAEDAAKALQNISEKTIQGPVNCCSGESLTLKDFLTEIEALVGKKAKLALEASEDNHSPYGISEDWFMDNSAAKSSGINFLPVKEILKLSFNNLK